MKTLELEKFIKWWGGGELSVSSIDDLFRWLLVQGIDEVAVNVEQMNMIAHFFVANARDTKEGAGVMKEGRIDRFMGIDLKIIL